MYIYVLALSLIIQTEPVLNVHFSFFEDSFRSSNRILVMFLLLLEYVGVDLMYTRDARG